jgi:Tol biopolymer transport system component
VLLAAGAVEVGSSVVSVGSGCRAPGDRPPAGAPREPTGQQKGALWVINADGSGRAKLADLPTGGDPWPETGEFGWTPDGTGIAFATPGGIAVIGATGAGLGQAVQGDAAIHPGPVVLGPEWAPDGKRRADLFQLIPYHVGGDQLRTPAWSPDGARIAFDDLTASSLDVINVDGTGRHVVVNLPGPYNMFGPAWSPDSRRLVFEVHGGAYFLGVVNADGTDLHRVAARCSGGNAVWSPDGRRIAFNDPWSLRLVDPDGRHLTRIAHTWYGTTPRWSPDGTRIAFIDYP